MLKSRALILVGLLLLVGGFGWGIAELFRLRFATGDVYPPYSSLRADPLGTRALYDSLDDLGGPRVRRDYRGVSGLNGPRHSTLLVLGLDFWELSASTNEFRRLDAFVRDGGRLVITLFPFNERPSPFALLMAGKMAGATNRAWSPPARKLATHEALVRLGDAWGFDTDFRPTPRQGQEYQPVTVQCEGGGPLPPTLTWHSGIVLTGLDPAWRVLYARGSNAVLAVRPLGRGAVALATDSFFVSNEALRDDRQPEVLAAVLGGGDEIIFDETHLGVQEKPGLASLARKYRLGGAAAALLGLALLFVWKNASPFLPRLDDARDLRVAGHDSASGFIKLLRRTLRAPEVLGVCWAEWEKTAGRTQSCRPQAVAEAAALVADEQARPPRERTPVATYRAISAVLHPRRREAGGGSQESGVRSQETGDPPRAPTHHASTY